MADLSKNTKLDPLTKVLQAKQIEQDVKKYLSEDKKYEGDTVFLVQLRCWDEISKRYGQKIGDAVLTHFTFWLTKVFRKTDLIGRIGARSFLIYALGCQEAEQIKKTAYHLRGELKKSEILRGKASDFGLYIGVCHTKGETDYEKLMEKVQTALFEAVERDQLFYIFQKLKPNISSMVLPIPEYRPDYADADVCFITEMIDFLFCCDDMSLSIEMVLSRLCDYFQVQRSCILEKNIDKKCYTISYEWTKKELLVENENLNLMPIWVGDRYQEAFDSHYMLVCNRLKELGEYNSFATQREKIRGTKALMESAILEYGEYIGCICMADLEHERVWKDREITTFSLVSKIIAANLLQVRSAQRSFQLTYNDRLTNSWNLNHFLQIGSQRLEETDRKKAVVTFDIKNFKLINMEYSYKDGDDILISIGNVVGKFIEPDECFAHIEADNFVLLLYYEDLGLLKQRLELLISRLERISRNRNISFQLMCMMGVYLVGPGDRDLSRMIDYANSGKKIIKEYHKSAYAFYNDKIEKQNQKERRLSGMMRQALEDGEFVVYYQPKIHIPTGKCIGLEALVRWIGKEHIVIQPDEFIPLFERNGFISEIDCFVLGQVCIQLQEWKKQGQELLPIAVNISRVHLQRTDFLENVQRICRQYDIQPDLIELEITESAFLEDSDIVLEKAKQLKNAGFMLSMDDFGTGYSSLSLLKDLPMDIIKLDKEFFHKTSSEREKIVISNVIHMAKELKMQVISEGIETKEQVRFLHEIGCDLAQGYFYSRPVPIETLEDHLNVPFGEEIG